MAGFCIVVDGPKGRANIDLMLYFDHIGYVVDSIADYARSWLLPMYPGTLIGETYEDPLQRVRVAFAEFPGHARLELIEPATPDSPVRKILTAKRGGLHHLCYSVDDMEQELERFLANGCLMISRPKPAVAFDGRRVAFLYTPQRDIIEFVEREK
jgi:methylmalonyl-CoA/ethylmalonyl-CoA epimerase